MEFNVIEVDKIADRVIRGHRLDKEEAMSLIDAPLDALCRRADEIRRHYLSDAFDVCAIINAKSGVCSEDCTFCAQSARHDTGTTYYPLLESDTIVKAAVTGDEKGIRRFSIVTSGKRLNDSEIARICEVAREVSRTTDLGLCVSIGLATQKQYAMLKEAGVTRIHNNLETSRSYFPEICSTHTYEDKLDVIETAKASGMEVCSGGIIGLGERMEDRIDMALDVRVIGAVSMPINILNPIPGTPLESNAVLPMEEIRRTIAIFRFINPTCIIRLAGGRKLLADKGKQCFEAGANAVITGDMLTTDGVPVEEDKRMIASLGFDV